ncbi:RNA polymerase subunit sigma-54 [Betaproteobacteria bacterium]|nr:RNA polymerase subunit sigma-54 [Betaproteobacteria bacterium]
MHDDKIATRDPSDDMQAACRVNGPISAVSYGNFESDIKEIFSSFFDVIYLSNATGVTQKVSGACETFWGLKPSDMIGRSVFDLERDGIFQPSVTRLVLETRQRMQSFQITKTGRKLVVIGAPIKNREGKIVQVVNLSRDITSETDLKVEMNSIKRLLDAYVHVSDGVHFKGRTSHQLVYASPEMARIAHIALKVSEVDSTVLITGESGVGKEVIASFIHLNSMRSQNDFIKVNCGAIPEALLESELFGYEKGAFTGASKDGKPGIFELANNGTLFLDEVSEISPAMQVKLLRVLQDGVFTRIGGVKPIYVDVRIIAASNRDLEKEMHEGRFRQDLYYRLNVVPIHIPALRDRPDDIPQLTTYFLNCYNRQYSKNKLIDTEVMRKFQEHCWRGNIRELQNTVERLVVLSDNDLIVPADLPPHFSGKTSEQDIIVKRIMPLKDAVASVEQQLIHMAMEKYGTTTRIAEALGVDQSTISRKLRRS